jgi:hypothetical protein
LAGTHLCPRRTEIDAMECTLMNVLALGQYFLEQQVRTMAAVLGGAATTWLMAMVVSRWRFRRFRSVFGYGVAAAENLALCLPHWTCRSRTRRVRYVRAYARGEAFTFYGPSRMLAKDDASGASLLVSLIAEVFHKPAVILPTQTRRALWAGRPILFGSPAINFHTAEIIKLRKGKPLPMEFVERANDDGGRRIIAIANPSTGDEYLKDGDVDYGVIIRNLQPDARGGRNYFFIVAGLASAGTWAASTHLHANWKAWGSKPDEFAILLRTPTVSPDLMAEMVAEV